MAVCGKSPRWPITGIPALIIALMISGSLPSSFTASAPALISRSEFATASASFSYDLFGRSATIRAFCLPLLTAFVNSTISSMVTGAVFS
uniref:Putative Ketopantoate hydroxymethyltransferase n=1 Tax=uncultured marine crenarchaeote HF4000_APKG8G15 TaxID=455605 RepID=B3TAW5_9ARCH|nr:putative Ketopantoate hydroxymethyltransferase [uncultured marine crenarchaeote HF4000_APKG8G15]